MVAKGTLVPLSEIYATRRLPGPSADSLAKRRRRMDPREEPDGDQGYRGAGDDETAPSGRSSYGSHEHSYASNRSSYGSHEHSYASGRSSYGSFASGRSDGVGDEPSMSSLPTISTRTSTELTSGVSSIDALYAQLDSLTHIFMHTYTHI